MILHLPSSVCSGRNDRHRASQCHVTANSLIVQRSRLMNSFLVVLTVVETPRRVRSHPVHGPAKQHGRPQFAPNAAPSQVLRIGEG